MRTTGSGGVLENENKAAMVILSGGKAIASGVSAASAASTDLVPSAPVPSTTGTDVRRKRQLGTALTSEASMVGSSGVDGTTILHNDPSLVCA
jgi:hypothetical protein